MKAFRVTDFEPRSAKEVYSAICSRQVVALMFHDEMADFFDFLGLYGFKQMHECQYCKESDERRHLKNYYMKHHHRILMQEDVEPEEVIPSDWNKYTRMDVTVPVRKQAVQRAMEQYRAWEAETKALYERCAYYLFSWHMIADFNMVNELVEDVSCELKRIEKLCIQLKSMDYDAGYVQSIQEQYYHKYSKHKEE